jgi:hypothetical protein
MSSISAGKQEAENDRRRSKIATPLLLSMNFDSRFKTISIRLLSLDNNGVVQTILSVYGKQMETG